MKKLLQGAILPFVMFTSGILLLGCEQASQPVQREQSADQTAQIERNQEHTDRSEQHSTPQTESLKQGNVFYIARDVANVQMKTGDYVEKLQQTQSDLQQALDHKDQAELQTTVKNLSRELQGFNTALISLDLKSQEIDDIRQQVLHANKQVLNSPLLDGDVDVSKVDFKKIERQMNSIQTDMLQLASMVIPTSDSDKSNRE